MTTNTNNWQTQQEQDELFQQFPAPRGWQFGGDVWAGEPHQKDTADFLPSTPASPQIEITIIEKASIR